MEDISEQDICTMDMARRASRMRKLTAVVNDERIQNLTEDLLGGGLSVQSFLKQASYTVVKALNRGLEKKHKRRRVA